MGLDLGLLIVRVVVGSLYIGHGSQKLFGWFGGGGFKGTTKMMESLGLHPVEFWALLAGLSEFGGGLLLLLGFLNPLGPLGIIAAMTFATAKVHWSKGVWNSKGGFEFPLTMIALSILIAWGGPGAFSLDAILGIALPALPIFIIGIVVVAIVTAIGLAMSNASAAQHQKTANQSS